LIIVAAAAGVVAGVVVLVIGALIVAALVRAMQAADNSQQASHDPGEAAALGSKPRAASQGLAALPLRAPFNIRLRGEDTKPPRTSGGANGESIEAANFRAAVGGLSSIGLMAPPPHPEPLAFAMANAQTKLTAALKPRIAHGIRLSRRI